MELNITLYEKKGFGKDGKQIEEPKIYYASNPNVGMVRKALYLLNSGKMSNLADGGLDEIEKFIIELFGNQFKIEEIEEKVHSEDFQKYTFGFIDAILKTMGVKLQQVPQVKVEKQES